MDFLKQNTRSYLDSRHVDKQFIDARDKDVVVIGGGDTGTDCVATALRHECRSLVQFELLPQSPDARSATNPWPQWPLVHRIDYGHEEYFHRQCGDPRKFSVKSKQFVRDNEGRVGGVETETLDWREGTQSTRSPAIVSGSAKIWPAQLVLLALGFVGPEEGLLTQLGVRVNERGNVEVDENKMTSVDKVFAAGDAERGQSLVVWAIADGRRAAASVDSYLAADYLSK